MPSPAGLAELLSDLAAALSAIGAEWYVFGAQAALMWGRPRLTTETFVRTTRVVPLEHRESGLALDVAGTVIPFISPEDLIVTKLLAGREKDIEDVRGVLSERGSTLDLGCVRATLALLEDAHRPPSPWPMPRRSPKLARPGRVRQGALGS